VTGEAAGELREESAVRSHWWSKKSLLESEVTVGVRSRWWSQESLLESGVAVGVRSHCWSELFSGARAAVSVSRR